MEITLFDNLYTVRASIKNNQHLVDIKKYLIYKTIEYLQSIPFPCIPEESVNNNEECFSDTGQTITPEEFSCGFDMIKSQYILKSWFNKSLITEKTHPFVLTGYVPIEFESFHISGVYFFVRQQNNFYWNRKECQLIKVWLQQIYDLVEIDSSHFGRENKHYIKSLYDVFLVADFQYGYVFSF